MNLKTDILNEVNYFSFDKNYDTTIISQKAENELQETAENKRRCLQELRERIESNKVTQGIDFLEEFLIQYLRHGKYNVNKAYKQLHNYVNVRKQRAELFRPMSTNEFVNTFSNGLITVLPKKCQDGCTIILIQLGHYNPNKMVIDDLWRILLVAFQQSLREPMTQVYGFKIIYDFENLSLKFLTQFTPFSAWFFYSTAMFCLPARYKQIFLFNESFVMRGVWLMIKGLLSEKMRKKIYFPKSLLEFFPESVLPVQYGGGLKNYTKSDWLHKAKDLLGDNPLEGHTNFS